MGENMQLLRWLLLLPGAVLFGMLGSVGGGFAATLFGQVAMDTASAFFGPFAFVCAVGAIAPSQRRKVTLGAAALITLLAISQFVLSTFTSVEPFGFLSTSAKVLAPTAQFLGSLYALFIIPLFVTAGVTPERVRHEVFPLAIIVTLLGALLAAIGLVIGLLGHGWIGLSVGLGVLFLGALTWLSPFILLTLRLKRVLAQAPATHSRNGFS